ncbi:MAG: permease-like cell division protein FtsX [Saprospiraceae bacterium]|nr:permease-like cell division protein FtsX [Saprospiraceae bacterium]
MAKSEDKYARRRLKTSYLSTIISITLVLFTIGLLGLVILHAKKLSTLVMENISLSVVMKENVREADIMKLKKTIDATDYVKSTKYITKEEATKEHQEYLGEDFVSFIGYSPLLPSIDVRVKASYANNDSLSIIESNLSKNPNVKEVNYQKTLVHKLNENIKKISFIILGLTGLLLLIAFALINNTIRLSVYSKRFLIKSMQLVGATQRFIRKPFIYKGLIQGLLGALLAIGLLIGVIYFSRQELPELIDLQEVDLFLSLFAIVTAMGLFISWISTFFAVRKYLKIKTDHLYYY